MLKPVARHVMSQEFFDYWASNPLRPGKGSIAGWAALERRTIHVPDVAALAAYEHRDAQRSQDFHTVLAVPLLRDDALLGVIVTWKTIVEPFSDKQVELIETFADQAVIAIENVRLFTALEARNRDLTEALEQQTATSEILRVISQSQTDVQPVFQTIATAALGLCRASSAVVATYDGEMIRVGAIASVTPEGADAIRALFPRPASRDNGVTRAVLTRALVTIPDVLADEGYRTTEHSLASGFRSIIAVPLLRDGSPIGAISLGRPEPGEFPDAQIALLQTFADQAVIAIENVRLFAELEARNRDLTDRAGTADRQQRDPARHQPVPVGRAAGVRHDRVGDAEAVRRELRQRVHVRWQAGAPRRDGERESRLWRPAPPVVPASHWIGHSPRPGRFSRATSWPFPTCSRIRSTATRRSRWSAVSAASSPCRCCATARRSAPSSSAGRRPGPFPGCRSTC